jgi:LuxR family maltose regulon positive regulatory protein
MPVLGTKLHVPSARHRLVPRGRLTGRLHTQAGSRPRLVLVSAPAGFGKTTLLAQWLGSAAPLGRTGPALRVAWLSLDPSDNGPRRFFRHLLAVLRVAAAEVGVEAETLLDAGRDISTEDFVGSLVNDLDALTGPTVLALDDDHLIDAAAVHEAVAFLVDNPAAPGHGSGDDSGGSAASAGASAGAR